MGYYPGSVPAGAGAGIAELTITQVPATPSTGYTSQGANATVFTFNAVTIGPASNDRWLAVFCGGDNSGNVRSLSSISCNGSPMTIKNAVGTAGNGCENAFAIIKEPSGTTADFVITWNNTMYDQYLAVFAIESSTGTLDRVDFDTDLGTTPTTVDALPGDVIIGCCVENGTAGALMSWTGSTEALYTTISNDNVRIAYEAVTDSVTRTADAVPASTDVATIMVTLRAL